MRFLCRFLISVKLSFVNSILLNGIEFSCIVGSFSLWHWFLEDVLEIMYKSL